MIHCPCGRWHKTVVGHPGPILWQMYDIIIFYQYIYFFRIFNARKILSGFVLPPPSLAQIISYLYWHVFCVYYQKLCCSVLCIRFITIQPDQYKWRWRLYLYIAIILLPDLSGILPGMAGWGRHWWKRQSVRFLLIIFKKRSLKRQGRFFYYVPTGITNFLNN